MNGHTTRDIECREYYATGTLKAGVAVTFVKKDGWSSWVVAHHKDVPFMSAHDWKYRFITVPADAVKETS